MSEERRIRELASRARMERAPRVDVADRVMAILRNQQRARAAEDRALAWVAGLSAAVAVPVALAAFATWQTWSDPLMATLVEFTWEMLI